MVRLWCLQVAKAEQTQTGLIEPMVDRDSADWWEGLAHGQLLLQACLDCGRIRFPPMPSCPYCGGFSAQDHNASGHGQLYSWVVVHRALHPEYVGEVPYTIAAVDLDDGPRIFGRFVGETDRLAAGFRVKAHFYSVNGRHMLGFEAE